MYDDNFSLDDGNKCFVSIKKNNCYIKESFYNFFNSKIKLINSEEQKLFIFIFKKYFKLTNINNVIKLNYE